MSKRLIRQSSSPFAAVVLFARKPDGALRFCIDYRNINSKTMKNWYPLPLLTETSNLLRKDRIYTKLDLWGAYNLLRRKKGDEYKLAFRMRYGLFEPTAMQFGMINAPADFQGYINHAITEALDDFASAYLDDILIYSDSEEDHVGHVEWVMQWLLEAGLYLKPEKCEFHKETVRYLGLIISRKDISMDEDKVETVRNWSREKTTYNGQLNTLFDVQQFLGFCKYCQRFVPKHSDKAESPMRLTKKDEPFVWESEQQLPFETMITAFTTAPAVCHFDHECEVNIELDASDYLFAGVLSQRYDEGVLHPEVNVSKKHTPAEWNYDIYDKQLMVIIKALQEWKPECEGAAYQLLLITDHKNLECFMTKKLLIWRQPWWSGILTHFDYEIVYRPGKSNGKADALMRRPGDLPEGGDERLKDVEQVHLKPQNPPEQLCLLAESPPTQGRPSIPDFITKAYATDPLPGEIPEAIRTNGSLKVITLAEWTEHEGRVPYQGKCYVPQGDQLRLQLIQEHHDTALAGHPDGAKMFDVLDRQYFWKDMRRQVDQYVRNCDSCQWSQSSRHSMFGVFQPLPVPKKLWEHIWMDCVVGLPKCEGFDGIWVEVDRLSKMAHFIPCHTTIDAIEMTELFLQEVVHHHGLPGTIISDWDPQFTSVFWG